MSIFHQSAPLKAGQIAYLAQAPWRLYVEAIDQIPAKESYWVRPLILTRVAEPFPETLDQPPASAGAIAPLSAFTTNLQTAQALPWHDVRAAAQLIWPQDAFCLALDTDLLPWLPILSAPASFSCSPAAKWALHRFLDSLGPQPLQVG
ncbi:MAG: hypothetical protein AAGF75_00575 [Cyanobacteria bacterium P01_H01_bin.130]